MLHVFRNNRVLLYHSIKIHAVSPQQHQFLDVNRLGILLTIEFGIILFDLENLCVQTLVYQRVFSDPLVQVLRLVDSSDNDGAVVHTRTEVYSFAPQEQPLTGELIIRKVVNPLRALEALEVTQLRPVTT